MPTVATSSAPLTLELSNQSALKLILAIDVIHAFRPMIIIRLESFAFALMAILGVILDSGRDKGGQRLCY